ncbi:2-dehydropantoate 2-reductase [Novosphingobium sp. RD2P27]|uniref:2-dehydropantoate 2-reductase n=1 Tax=Novosphingobium kalidii TaxID=3230299 RepID=A0ABV2D1H4_9SPHN
MRVAVVGAGAMGSLFAARLALAGHDLHLAEISSERRAQIESRGVVFEIAGQAGAASIACGLPADLPAGHDVLILFTKFGALRPALAGALHALKDDGIVVVLANGLGIAEALNGLVPAERLILGVTDVAADMRDGCVHSDGSGILKLGVAAGESGACDTVAALLASGGFAVHPQADVRGAIWEKVAFNAAFNALATIVDVPVEGLDNEAGRRLVGCVLAEVTAVARAEGVPFDPQTVRARIAAAFRHQGHHMPSMVQDRRAGRTTEIAAINGAIADRGERSGVAVPVNRTLADLVVLTGG